LSVVCASERMRYSISAVKMDQRIRRRILADATNYPRVIATICFY